MKSFTITLFICTLLFSTFYFNACDDSGVVTPSKRTNFSFANLKRLDQMVDGVYEAWMRLPSGSGYTYISCGRFNISADNNVIVDPQGNPVTLRLKWVPANINAVNCALVTIVPPGYSDTNFYGTRILGGTVAVADTTLTSSLSMTYSEVLGSIAQNIPGGSAKYILNTPTSPDTTDFYKGIWFCDITPAHNSLFTGLGVIPASLDWVYEGWIVYKPNPSMVVTTGRFSDPGHADNDGPGPYHGPDSAAAYDRPGEDFVAINSPFATLESGSLAVMITLEPKIEQGPAYGKPFFIKLFYQDIPTNLTYGQISNAMVNYGSSLPTATIQVSTRQ